MPFHSPAAALLRYCAMPLALLGGFPSQAAEPTDINITYGRITSSAPVDVESHTGKAALVGGLLGAATSGMMGTGSAAGDIILGSAAGAATGGGIEYWGEQRMKGTRFSIETTGAQTIHIISDQEGLDTGDCVAIEATPDHTNMRPVSAVYCEEHTSVQADEHLNNAAQSTAAQCREAKMQLINAQSADAVASAKTRVRALCGF